MALPGWQCSYGTIGRSRVAAPEVREEQLHEGGAAVALYYFRSLRRSSPLEENGLLGTSSGFATLSIPRTLSALIGPASTGTCGLSVPWAVTVRDLFLCASATRAATGT